MISVHLVTFHRYLDIYLREKTSRYVSIVVENTKLKTLIALNLLVCTVKQICLVSPDLQWDSYNAVG